MYVSGRYTRKCCASEKDQEGPGPEIQPSHVAVVRNPSGGVVPVGAARGRDAAQGNQALGRRRREDGPCTIAQGQALAVVLGAPRCVPTRGLLSNLVDQGGKVSCHRKGERDPCVLWDATGPGSHSLGSDREVHRAVGFRHARGNAAEEGEHGVP